MIAIIPLSGCADPDDPLSNTTSDTQVDTTPDTQADATVDTVGSEATSATEEIEYEPYTIHEIIDDRITIEGSEKMFCDLGITVSIPSDWLCLEINGEDGSSYFFREPELGDKCQLYFCITGSVYAYQRTEDEYLEYFSSCGETDVKIISLTKEKLSGFECTKVVHSYSYEGTEYIEIHYDNVVTGVRLYDFTITYPASEKETFEPVFASIMDSLELTPV